MIHSARVKSDDTGCLTATYVIAANSDRSIGAVLSDDTEPPAIQCDCELQLRSILVLTIQTDAGEREDFPRSNSRGDCWSHEAPYREVRPFRYERVGEVPRGSMCSYD